MTFGKTSRLSSILEFSLIVLLCSKSRRNVFPSQSQVRPSLVSLDAIRTRVFYSRRFRDTSNWFRFAHKPAQESSAQTWAVVVFTWTLRSHIHARNEGNVTTTNNNLLLGCEVWRTTLSLRVNHQKNIFFCFNFQTPSRRLYQFPFRGCNEHWRTTGLERNSSGFTNDIARRTLFPPVKTHHHGIYHF